METSALLTQMRKGALEACVLALLEDGERYGFELVQRLGPAPALLTSEGTIYPLLSRLHRERLVETEWRESPAGPPRKYYRLTPRGREALAAFRRQWVEFRDAVDAVLGTGESGGDAWSATAAPTTESGV
ncbi:MAG: PadR family transcriptional regulator [Sphaerobacter sp.]|nr:PadR family transcriptional regulator [Sphaerobacter sp.]